MIKVDIKDKIESVGELAYWNSRTYGDAIRLKKRWLILGFVILCIITPFTNWMIPFLGKVIRYDLVLRF